MRISVKEGDPGYCAEAFKARVFFNDVEQKGTCITADEEQGLIVRFIKNEDGGLVVNNGEAMTETVTGKVRIILEDD
jgi:hypothetical protein